MLLDNRVKDFIDVLASNQPIPGGGGACALVGALGDALGLMVANLTIDKPKYHEAREELIKARERLEAIRSDLMHLVDEDAEAFKPLSEVYKMPRDTQAQIHEREVKMEQALVKAGGVPLQIMECLYETMPYIELMARKGSPLALSDAGVAILFIQSAIEGAALNVYINTSVMKNRSLANEYNQRAQTLIETGKLIKERVNDYVLARLAPQEHNDE